MNPYVGQHYSPQNSPQYQFNQQSKNPATQEYNFDPNQPSPHKPSHLHNHNLWDRTGRDALPTTGTTKSTKSSRGDKSFGEDHIRVVVRVRPLNEREKGNRQGVNCAEDEQTIQIAQGTDVKPLTFDRVYNQNDSQSLLFEECGVKELIDKALEGSIETSLFSSKVYVLRVEQLLQLDTQLLCLPLDKLGQVGKTFTMTGPDDAITSENQGLVPRSLRYIYEQIDGRTSVNYTVKAAYLEIYNEQVQDLLNPSSTSLNLRWSKEKGFYVENLFIVVCEILDDCMAVLEEGLRNRKTGSHALNEKSSRSHTILTLYLDYEICDPDDNRIRQVHGKISFVDLAGSERVKESKTSGDMLTETFNINKSLLTLGNCISALSDSKRRIGHIPYRDSKLTKLLMDSLGGNGMALMISCISPSANNLSETLKTLRYASRAKKIRNRPVVQIDPKEALIISLKREINHLRAENTVLRNIIGPSTAMRNQLDNVQRTDIQGLFPRIPSASPRDVDGYRNLVHQYAVEIDNLKYENIELIRSKTRTEHNYSNLMRENEKLREKLEEMNKELEFHRSATSTARIPLKIVTDNPIDIGKQIASEQSPISETATGLETPISHAIYYQQMITENSGNVISPATENLAIVNTDVNESSTESNMPMPPKKKPPLRRIQQTPKTSKQSTGGTERLNLQQGNSNSRRSVHQSPMSFDSNHSSSTKLPFDLTSMKNQLQRDVHLLEKEIEKQISRSSMSQ